jgi:mRNA-degrading endonuclease RelE of RelBE toxin-antitoxin system
MNKIPDNIIVYERGRYCIVACAQKKSGKSPADEFFDSLGTSDRLKFKRLFKLMCDEGKIENKQKFRKLKGDSGLGEFKSKPYRIFTFRKDDIWFLTHGFKKESDDTPPEEIIRGVNIMNDHLNKFAR